MQTVVNLLVLVQSVAIVCLTLWVLQLHRGLASIQWQLTQARSKLKGFLGLAFLLGIPWILKRFRSKENNP